MQVDMDNDLMNFSAERDFNVENPKLVHGLFLF